MARKKCPREGTRLKFDANPASAMLYSPPIPHQGEVGTVVSIPLPGAGRKTCTGGHQQDLVYVNWPSIGTMGVARADTTKVRGKGPRQLQVNGPADDRAKTEWLARFSSEVSKLLEGAKETPTWQHLPAGHMYYGMGLTPADAAARYVAQTSWRDRMHGLGESAYRLSIGQRVSTPLGPGSITMVRGIHAGVQLDDGKFAHFTVSNVTPTGERQRYLSGAERQREIVTIQVVTHRGNSNADVINMVKTKLQLGAEGHVFVTWRGPGPHGKYDLSDVEVGINDRVLLNKWVAESYSTPSVRPGKIYNIKSSERSYQG